MLDEQGRQWCDRCAALIAGDGAGGYLVRIEVLADPQPPALDSELSDEELRERIRRTCRELEDLSGQEAMDQVYRRFEFLLCPSCQRQYLEDPLNR